MMKLVAISCLATVVEACDMIKFMECGKGSSDDQPADAAAQCAKSQSIMDCQVSAGCGAMCETGLNLVRTNPTMQAVAAACPNLNCGGCFPATATVQLSNGKTKSMNQIKIGDMVRVGPDEYSEVYFFSTEMAETNAKFTKIVAGDAELVLTSGHYLYVNGELAPARSVKSGDVIVLADGNKTAVNEVTDVWGPGLYNPHTLHGDIVVNGVKTSTYTDAVHPKLAHALLSPLRTMYSVGASFGQGFSSATKGLPAFLLKAIAA